MEAAHGTHLSGIIAEVADTAGADVSILPIKAFQNGCASTSDVLKAIAFADAHGAVVINCSFGSASGNAA
jgi:subtilisin family serine protease